jgi:hypothetical protein
MSAASPLFTLTSAECGWGQIGIGGNIGFHSGLSRHVTPLGAGERGCVISAHPPSRIVIDLHGPARLDGYLNATTTWAPQQPTVFLVNENPIGVAYGPMERAGGLLLSAGRYTLRTLAACPDARHSCWQLSVDHGISRSGRLRVVTVACYPEHHAWREIWHMSQSLQRQGFLAEVMGIGTEYRNHADAKIHRLLEFIETQQCSYVLYIDGKDSLVLANEEELISDFKSIGADFVISMERGCWPVCNNPAWEARFPEVAGGFRWPNAGGWMGTRSGVLRVLRRAQALARQASGADLWDDDVDAEARQVLQAYHLDDQALLQWLYLRGQIVGDLRCRLFTNVGTASPLLEDNPDYVIGQGLVELKYNGEHPKVIHFSGGACSACRDQWSGVLFQTTA